MKIYTCEYHDVETGEVLGIFSTLEKAEEYQEKTRHQSWPIDVFEYDLDSPKTGWPYGYEVILWLKSLA